MKVYIAKDWTGSKVFSNPPRLLSCGGIPDIWSGHKLSFQIAKDIKIPRGKYLERSIWWSIVNIV